MNWLTNRQAIVTCEDALIKLTAQIECLSASLKEYVDYDLLTSDCPNCYMCNEGRTEDDTGQCIHQKAVALLAEVES